MSNPFRATRQVLAMSALLSMLSSACLRWGTVGNGTGGGGGAGDRRRGRRGRGAGGKKTTRKQVYRVMNIPREVCGVHSVGWVWVEDGRGMQVRTLACTLEIPERGGVYFMWGINLNFNYHYFLINLFTFGGPSGREIRCGK